MTKVTPLILIVDDERPIRELLALLLDERGYRTAQASNGRQALDRLAEEVPELVLTDLMMPALDGAELCRRLKSDPATSGVRVVLMSASEFAGRDLPQADAIVRKPFDIDQLETLIERTLAG